MTYSVTGIRMAPDVGFRSAHRQTAQGAREAAADYLAEGMLEIEVRDHRGNLCSTSQLERAAHEFGDEERGAADRLSALY